MDVLEANKTSTLSAAVTSLINEHIEAMGKQKIENLSLM